MGVQARRPRPISRPALSARVEMQHQKSTKFIAAGRRPPAEATLSGTVRQLWPYIWRTARGWLELPGVCVVLFMGAPKRAPLAIPYAYKWATDALAGDSAASKSPLPAVLSGVVALTVAYGLLRILMALFTQGRDALFAAVAMNAVRRLAIEVFVHLHQLSPRFHLERKTGGLTRILERGR